MYVYIGTQIHAHTYMNTYLQVFIYVYTIPPKKKWKEMQNSDNWIIGYLIFILFL